jgi:hypothetical protein
VATITSGAAGNYSSTATWVGGVVPGAADVAVAAHVVTVNQDVTATELRSSGSGQFRSSAAGRTINANIVATTTDCLLLTGSGSTVINGNVTGSATAAEYGVWVSNSHALTVVGTSTGGDGATAYGTYSDSTGAMSFTNCQAGAGSNSHGVVTTTTSAIVTVTNEVRGNTRGAAGSTNASAFGIANLSSASTVRILKIVCGTGGVFPVFGPASISSPSTFTIKCRDSTLTEHTFDAVTTSQSGKLIGIGGGLIG